MKYRERGKMINYMLLIMKNLVLFLAVKLPLQLISYPLMYVYFRYYDNPKSIRLPYFLKWFGIWEWKHYGINGDQYWQDTVGTDWKSRYVQNVLRNPVNHFQWTILGKVTPHPTFRTLKVSGSVTDSNLRGYALAELTVGGTTYAREIYALFKYPLLEHGLRIRIGHKILDIDKKVRPRLQFAFSITPWKRIRPENG